MNTREARLELPRRARVVEPARRAGRSGCRTLPRRYAPSLGLREWCLSAVRSTRYGLDGYRIWHKATASEDSGLRVVRDGGATVRGFRSRGALVDRVLPGGLRRLDGPGLAVRYALRDHLGTARVVVDGAGEVTDATDFYAFGLRMPGRVLVNGTPTQEGYTGHELDAESGLNYAGARCRKCRRWARVCALEQIPYLET